MAGEQLRYEGLFGPAEVAGIAGACYELLAGRSGGSEASVYAGQAAEHINMALKARERFYVRSRVLDLLGLANVRLYQGEPGEAARIALTAVECSQGLRSARVGRRFHRFAVRGSERYPRSSEVADFAEQVRAMFAVVP